MSTLAPFPRIEDGPLVLRAFSDGDAEFIQEVSSDPLIVPIDPVLVQSKAIQETSNIDQMQALIDIARSHYTESIRYYFAIADAETGNAVGHIGLGLKDLQNGRASVGYWLAERKRGQGMAGHALRMLSAWAFTLPGIDRLELYVEPWNEASWRTAERVGYQREGLLRRWWSAGDERRDVYVYSLLRSDPR
ncbi:GNAT family N-acetyltransferase [Actinoallomurus sp. CA-150999]|uniref:GNAT family N-acetyltransferase n=1 Tax=Actinoallomurus sp. CA-150999 TaxID=3239887 RepID=UPI003D94288B